MEKATTIELELVNLKRKQVELIDKLKNKQNPVDLVCLKDINLKIQLLKRSIRN